MPEPDRSRQEGGNVMELKCIINGRPVAADVAADLSLLQFLRAQGYKSVKCGCRDDKLRPLYSLAGQHSVLSCAVPGHADSGTPGDDAGGA